MPEMLARRHVVNSLVTTPLHCETVLKLRPEAKMTPAEKFEPEQAERRASSRYPCEDVVGIDLLTEGRRQPALVRDVSLEGMKLSLAGACAVGTPVQLEHPVAGSFRGICVWREQQEIGIVLIEPAREIERVLQCVCLLIGGVSAR